eukprot:gene8878-3758_t
MPVVLAASCVLRCFVPVFFIRGVMAGWRPHVVRSFVWSLLLTQGESVANLADILGTVFGIALSKMNLPMFPTFCVLSCGYLIASRKVSTVTLVSVTMFPTFCVLSCGYLIASRKVSTVTLVSVTMFPTFCVLSCGYLIASRKVSTVTLVSVAMFPTFCVLSCGYLIASRKEVDSVELPYLNRARLAYAARKYLEGNGVPDVQEANQNEPLLPWGNYNQRRILLGSSVDNACYDPGDLALATKTWSGEKALLTYRPDTAMVHILLLEGCTTPDCMRAAFAAHLFLHILDGKPVMAQPAGQKGSKIGKQPAGQKGSKVAKQTHTLDGKPVMAQPAGQKGSKIAKQTHILDGKPVMAQPARQKGSKIVKQLEAVTVSAAPWHAVMEEARARVDTLLPDFLNSAQEHGWMLQQTMLNPKDTRLMQLQPLSIV